jgi:hypothetical protein
VWSPDGSEIAFASNDISEPSSVSVIYPDGSCLACSVTEPLDYLGPGEGERNVDPGFLPDGRLGVSIEDSAEFPPPLQVGAMNTDGIGFQPFAVSGSWQQPAWSSTGQLAAVRVVRPEVFVIDPATGSARQLTRDGATSPSWSPDGRRLAVVHDGWIELIGSGGGRARRLTRGRVPAWAPNGKELAFVGADGRLFVISVRGGRPRPVGHIRAVRVDWQPVTRKPPHCQVPTGASIAAASPDATVAIDPAPTSQGLDTSAPAFSVLGCLTSDGRERLLESLPASNEDAASGVGPVAVTGDYAALVNESGDSHYGGVGATVAVYDLRTGTVVANRGGESAGGFYAGIDQLVLGPNGSTAAHTWEIRPACGTCATTTVEQIVANDNTGTHILDSITTGPDGPIPSSLSQLSLSGDTLTWSHDGTPESAQLH